MVATAGWRIRRAEKSPMNPMSSETQVACAAIALRERPPGTQSFENLQNSQNEPIGKCVDLHDDSAQGKLE